MDQPIRPKKRKPRIRPWRGEFYVLVRHREVIGICQTLGGAFELATWRFVQEAA